MKQGRSYGRKGAAKREVCLKVQVSREERDAFEDHATRRGLTLSAYLRQVLGLEHFVHQGAQRGK